MRRLVPAGLALLCLAAPLYAAPSPWLALPAASGSPALAPLNAIYPDLEALYMDLHQNPELSLHEEKTSAKLAARMRALGYDVTERVGGWGVVAVMKNGKGPTVLVRADMDALPLEERTGLPYASKVRVKNDAGVEVPVMHACGHDVHMTSLIGAATLLARAKARWRGTLVLVAQPAEEGEGGALNMIADGLLTRFPKPDVAIAIHDFPFLPAGKVGVTPGFALANVDSVDITIYGRGGHGSAPQNTVDPVVIAARTVLALQTIVSRENDPRDPVVVTVGSIHGGTKHNIIPDEVKLQLTVRTYKPEVRAKTLAAIARIVKAEAAASGAPKEPAIAFDPVPGTATYNDLALARTLTAAFTAAFGAGNVVETQPVMGGEDFGKIGDAAKIPSVLFWVGGTEPGKFAAAGGDMTRLPYLHSSEWAPDREPTLKTGAAALTVGALALLGKP
jgi:hippurate hydrolase